jgi:Zn-dependent membrane protease YugP
MYLIIIIIMLASWLVSFIFQSKFKKFSELPTFTGLSGKETAERMLRDHQIFDVEVKLSEGTLSDHYDPRNKTVNLSPDVYNGRSVAAAAVSAHECGHAVQHATAYAWLQFRSGVVPILSVTNRFTPWLLIIGVFTINMFPPILGLGVLFLALTTLFSFITLPVEFDASNRAIQWLDNSQITMGEETAGAKSALGWAAMTYVVAALSSLGTLIYYAYILFARRD